MYVSKINANDYTYRNLFTVMLYCYVRDLWKCQPVKALKTKISLNYIYGHSPYRAVNTISLL